MVISNDPTINLIIRIVISVVSIPIILITLLGSGMPLVYSFFATVIPITIFLLITKNKKSHDTHIQTQNQYCIKCGGGVASSNNYCTKCGATVN